MSHAGRHGPVPMAAAIARQGDLATDADRVLGNGKNDGDGRGGRFRCPPPVRLLHLMQ
jgi:hypothetical protein